MAIIYTYPKISKIDPSDLLIITDVSDPENQTRSTTVQELANTIALQQYPQRYIMNGLVNNLGSQTSGLDFMEWTSNVTGPDQIPLIRTTDKLLLEYVTWVWMGSSPVTIGPGEQIEFTMGTIADGVNSVIANYVPEGILFRLKNSDNGTYVHGEADVTSLNIVLQKNDNIAVVGTETGSFSPNNGELAISFRFKEL
tara:strand:+ start:1067 stop:1657 length:591 start_codon:yes stop_codon:yes gene_type:complete